MEKALEYFLVDLYLKDMYATLPSSKAKDYFDSFLQYNYCCYVEHNIIAAEKAHAKLCETKRNLAEEDILFFQKHIYHGVLAFGQRECFLKTDTFDLYKDWFYGKDLPNGNFLEYQNKHLNEFLKKWTRLLSEPCKVSYCPLKRVYVDFVFDDMVFYLTPSTLKCDDDNVFEHYIDTMMSDLQKIGAVKLRYHGMID